MTATSRATCFIAALAARVSSGNGSQHAHAQRERREKIERYAKLCASESVQQREQKNTFICYYGILLNL